MNNQNTPSPIKDDRSFLKLLLLSIVTLGIYELWHLHHWTKDINELCKEDGKHNEGLLLYVLLTLVTCGLFPTFWWFKAADRLSRAGVRESVATNVGGGKILVLTLLGMITYGITFLYAQYLMIQATNDLATNYNSKYVYAKSVIDGTAE
jgi:hypothetical protein